MKPGDASIYRGQVVHLRLRPVRHKLVYRVFSLLLDLDALPAIGRRWRLFSHNRFNLFSFHDRDHGPGDGTPPRVWIDRQLAAAGIELDDGRIEVMCYPRILGYIFNPLTVYFCRRPDETLAAVVYEVSNTFGERHSYVIPVVDPASAVVRQACDKAFYVSPFNDVAGRYRFRVKRPANDVEIVVNYVDDDGVVLHAAFRGTRSRLTDGELLSAFVRYPLMTLKVMAGIHWEALRLWRKGLRLVRRPAPPSPPVTIVALEDQPAPSSLKDSTCLVPARHA